MKYYLPFSIFFSLLILSSCFHKLSSCFRKDDRNIVEIKLIPEKTHQIIHNFGASDCWSGQFIGNWPDDQKDLIADLLFSRQLDKNGNPVGIGLSCWRFNIGAGSANQGNNSNIEDEWRRAPGCLNDDGSYNWDALAAQRWLLRAAKGRGCEQFVAFLNSPPVQYTKNKKAYSSGGESGNLSVENYAKYANFLADFIINIKNLDGIAFDYLSPFNEPEWDWKAGEDGKARQEGSPWMNQEIKDICQHIDNAFSARNISTLIEIPESGQLNFFYETGDKPGRSNHIEDFFSPSSPNYLGNLPHMATKIAGHSYFTTWDNIKLIETRQKVIQKLAETNPDLEFWMSEYCILEDNKVIHGMGKDLGMTSALYIAKVIHGDLVMANANAWHWWLAISPYNYKDGLIYIDKSKTGGNIETSKMLWGLGNFSRFITPGSKRIGIVRSDHVMEDAMDGLLISGYQTPEGKYICVLINPTLDHFKIKVKPDQNNFSKVTGFITSKDDNHNLTRIDTGNPGDLLEIPSESIITLVFEKKEAEN